MADEERFCDGCGMASFGAEDMRARAGRTRDEAAQAEQSVPCRSCGTPVTGKRCPGCGTRKPDSEL